MHKVRNHATQIGFLIRVHINVHLAVKEIYMYDLILTMNVIKTHNLLLTRLMTTDRLAY